MPLPQLATTLLLSAAAATVVTVQIIGIVRDADWWVITRDTARGRAEQFGRTIRRH